MHTHTPTHTRARTRAHAQDGTSKMSKSAENDGSRINLLDPPEVIAAKIKRAKTDAFTGACCVVRA